MGIKIAVEYRDDAGNPVNLTIEHAKQTGTLSELVYREIARETA